jgi:hypothetical protein
MRWLAVGLCLGLLSACVQEVRIPSQPSPTASSQSKEPGWQIRLDTSGGFAGVHRTLNLSNDGKLTAVDAKLARQVVAQAPENELRNIESQLDKITPIQATGRLPTCPDCYEYALDVHFRGQLYSTRLNDRTLPGSGLQALVNALVDLQERALAGKLNP